MTQSNHKPFSFNDGQIHVQGVGSVKPSVQVVERHRNNFGESIYLVEIVKGLGVTVGHVLKNLVGWRSMPTVSYPEVKRDIPEGYRGKHRLTTREDGSSKCVACMMCATAAPMARNTPRGRYVSSAVSRPRIHDSGTPMMRPKSEPRKMVSSVPPMPRNVPIIAIM